jgi:hypothetical protein
MQDLPMSEIFRHYSTPVDRAYYSFTVPQTIYVPEKKAVAVNKAPLRYTESRYDENIDTWIKLLTGAYYNKVCDWLAASVHLDHPCAALYLNGPPGCGKSLFAHGVGTLYREEGAISFEEAAGHFNDGLAESPICVVDETINMRTDRASSILRRLITTAHHDVNVKCSVKLSIESFVRVIIAANNDNVLMSGREENLSEADSLAVAERILYIKVKDNKARDFFLEKNEGAKMTRQWLKEGYFARHILWLAQNRELDKESRFLVTGESSDMHKKITYQGGERSLVWDWLAKFAEAPNVVNGRIKIAERPAHIGNGLLAVNVTKMHENFGAFGEEDKIKRKRLLDHVRNISGHDENIVVRIKSGDGKLARFWPIEVEKILDYAKDNDIGDVESILKNAQIEDDEVTTKILQSSQYKTTIA